MATVTARTIPTRGVLSSIAESSGRTTRTAIPTRPSLLRPTMSRDVRSIATQRPLHQSSSTSTSSAGPPHPPSSTGAFSSSPSSSSSSPSDPSLGPLRIIHPPSHLTSYLFPAHLRRHYLALQSLFLELSLIPTTVSSEILARIRYGWWREALQMCFDTRNANVNFDQGEVGTAAKRYKHPIVVAVEKAIWDRRVLQSGGLVQDHFEAIIDAWETSLGSSASSSSSSEGSSSSSSASLETLEATSERIYSRQLYLHLNLLGVSSSPVDEIFSHLGKAMGILESILDVPSRLGVKLNPNPSSSSSSSSSSSTPDPARIAKNRKPSLQDSTRRLSLPRDYLQKHSVVQEDVLRHGGAAKGFRDAVFDTATRANDYLITARTTMKKELNGGRVGKEARPALVGATVVPFLLNRLEAYDFDPFVPAFRFEAKGQGWRLPWLMYKTHWTGRL